MPFDLDDLFNFTPIPGSLDKNHHINGLPNRPIWDLRGYLPDKVFKPGQRLMGAIRVNTRTAARMAGVPRLQQRQRGLPVPHLAADNPIRPQTQNIEDQIRHADRIGARLRQKLHTVFRRALKLARNRNAGAPLRARSALDPPRLGEREEGGSHRIEEAGREDAVFHARRLRAWNGSEVVARP